ncbi:MAG: Gfo/Idh/MocA family oxidoreductase [Sphingomonadales bacterium]|nr:Gfo/Idh/MocA family oxidoreductase [Sphingomonadales bacterium]
MVGGGEGAFIGAVHRTALAIDGRCELVCGALSSTADKAKRSGLAIGLADDRSYSDYRSMLTAEAALPEEIRMQAVAIVTPNHAHFDVAMAALDAGFHVFCEKPMVMDMTQAQALASKVRETGLVFGLAHTYAGYPLVHQARSLVAAGRLGAIRKIIVEYPQGWLARMEEGGDNKQADWRTDPARAGGGGAIGDIGTHAHQLAEMISGEAVTEVRAELTRFVDGRRLDDDAEVAFRLSGGGKGHLLATQIAIGEENGLRIRVHGEKASLRWLQEEPNSLWFQPIDQPAQLWRAAAPYLDDHVAALCRTPMGHPEGYLEAFATLYLLFADRVAGKAGNDKILFPDIDTGLRGMAFLEAVIASDHDGGIWRKINV